MQSVLTRIDHVMICVANLEQGIEAYTRLGFNIHPGGVHRGRGTHNAIAFFEEDYPEVMGGRDRQEYLSSAGPGGGLLEFLSHGDGLRFVIVQSDDLGADVAAMRRRGVEVGEPSEGGRRTPAGHELRWKMAVLGPDHPLPILFIQHLTPLAERRAQLPQAGNHPNGVRRTERVYIAVPDVAAAAKAYSRVLGMSVPPIQRGAAIKADMAAFDLRPPARTAGPPPQPRPPPEAL